MEATLSTEGCFSKCARFSIAGKQPWAQAMPCKRQYLSAIRFFPWSESATDKRRPRFVICVIEDLSLTITGQNVQRRGFIVSRNDYTGALLMRTKVFVFGLREFRLPSDRWRRTKLSANSKDVVHILQRQVFYLNLNRLRIISRMMQNNKQ